jgi:RNA polymerase sigma-70 factor (ECF subfamily)
LVALSPEQRNVLRLHLLDGLNIDQIGLIHQVHRATVARWLARARETVRDDTRRRLAAKIAVDGPELESIVTALHSQLDVSVQRILRELG